MNPKQIAIIGIKGQFGSLLSKELKKLGFEIDGCDKNYGSLQDCIKNSEVVIFAVPIRETSVVMKAAVPFSNKEQLWLDITSLKQKPVEDMLKSKAFVIGTHPMFAPSQNAFKEQKVILTPGRDTQERAYLKFSRALFKRLGANTVVATPEEHDLTMSYVQQTTHFMYLCFGMTVANSPKRYSDSLEFVSPVYKIALIFLGRMLTQDPKLYFDIQHYNPYSKKTLKEFLRNAKKLQKVILKGDEAEFVEIFSQLGVSFGEKSLRESVDLSNFLINKTIGK